MFRILIVEDVKDTLRELKAYIEEAFAKFEDGAVKIYTAGTVADGKRLIQEAFSKKRPFHAVVLDFRLPAATGHNTNVDETLCLLMRELMPSTLVAHITAYGFDEVVERHLRLVHHGRLDPRAFTLYKTDEDYSGDLVRQLKAFLYGMRIEEQLVNIFGADEELSFAARGRMLRNPGGGGGSVTHNIAALTRDIEAHWHELDMQMQQKIKKIFRVEDQIKPVRVSLLRRSPEQTESVA